jgi:hypothetical protein
MKVHKINTIQDLANVVTKDNYEALLEDIAHSLAFYVKLKKDIGIRAFRKLKIGEMEWKDDGIRGVTHVYCNDEKVTIKRKEDTPT